MKSAIEVRTKPDSTALRLLLAVLLVVTPLLTVAGGMSSTGTAADGVVETAGQVEQRMPCHAADGPAVDSTGDGACPHCSADGPLSQCECCTLAAPPGLVGRVGVPAQPPFSGMTAQRPRNSSLPESPGDRLFRPPIFRG